jgi:hypothetical protein
VVLHEIGLSPWALQLEVRRPDGALIGRADFAWEDLRLNGDIDGRITYGRLLRSGPDPGDAVVEEKRRDDAIREEGWGVVRWTWADLTSRDPLRARLLRAMGHGRS